MKQAIARRRNGEHRANGSRMTDGHARQPSPPFPRQHQPKPGLEHKMILRRHFMATGYRPASKLEAAIALITGGDSGIGRAVATLYARSAHDIAIVFLPAETQDAEETRRIVQASGRECLLLPGDLTEPAFCESCVQKTVRHFGKLDILVNNAAYQDRVPTIAKVTDEEFDKTFKTNIYAYFYLARSPPNICNPGRPSSRQAPRPAWKVPINSSPIHPPKVRSTPSPKRWPWNWLKKAFASTLSRRGPYGRRSTPPTAVIRPAKSVSSARRPCSTVPPSRRK